MTKKLIYPIVVVVFAAACGGDGETGKRAGQQQYETVQEGSAAGVTAALNGPGETLPPITNTNADTTSAFTLDPNAVPTNPQQQPQPTMAGTIPSAGASPAYNPTPSAPPMARAPQREASYSSPAPQRQVYTPPPMTSASQSRPPQQQQPRPVERETVPVEEPVSGPAATDSSQAPPPATNTDPLPPSRQQPQQQQEAPAEEPEDSEEQAEEPPPPPPIR